MKFMLPQDHFVEGVEPMTSWSPEDAQADIQFQRDLNQELRERGELVEANALTAPELAKFVASDGVDVEPLDRASEIAAKGSAAPGPGGSPIKQRIEVREVLDPVGPDW